MTAGEVVERIRKNIGVPWRETTYRDTYKSGGPETPVTGIATTMFNSFDAIQRAVAAGLNMILPHETTFWNDRDDVAVVNADALYREKRDYLAAHNVVIFRMHDHVHDRRPDFTYVGIARELGLDPARETPPGSHRFTISGNHTRKHWRPTCRGVWRSTRCAWSEIRRLVSAAPARRRIRHTCRECARRRRRHQRRAAGSG